MVMIQLTDDERSAGALSADHLTEAVEAVRRDGYVVLEKVVDEAHLDALHERIVADVALLQARPDAPYNWHAGNVQQDPPPFEPFLFRDVLVNEFAIQVTSAILGPGMTNVMYGGNTALPSENRQPVHADVGHLWPVDVMEVAHPPAELVVNVLTVDVSAENGGTEIWPGTHRELAVGAGDDIEIPLDILEARRAVAPPFQATFPRGSMMIRDIRLWHAGMPNHTDQARPMIAMIHRAGFLSHDNPLRFPAGSEELLAHPVLRQAATYVEGDIDYINAPGGHAYTPES
ncbi:phytanoyl-CoA dioxygenase family protein [Aestuariimicrobium soli]|uniref:phytanoyl-CoA dioxygenase family protein n=1 Tax=Aestuariimicrobium soli TaxID=2035834 RepID=UPI003EBFBCF9